MGLFWYQNKLTWQIVPISDALNIQFEIECWDFNILTKSEI